MKKFFQNSGNSWQLYLNRPVVQLLGISDNNFDVLIEVYGKTLIVRHLEFEEKEKFKNFLVKKLIKRGSGFGLNFPLPILELLDINPEIDGVEIEIEGNKMIIKKG